jgi:glycosyltransferase involved in cell wall biosynthesis
VKLLVDVQCVQSSSSLRGIGRYALSLTRGLVQEAGEHSIELLLNGGDDVARALRARAALESFLPSRRIHVFDADWPWAPSYDDRRRPAAEAAYAAAVRSLGADALLIASPIEGDRENVMCVRSSPTDPPAAAVLYDLIPALDPGTYLMGPGASSYWRRLEHLKRCDALLAISRHSRDQAHQLLAGECPPVTPIWGGPYPSGDFPAFEPQADDVESLALPERFILSVGGDHPRKNLDRLVEAWSRVPVPLRRIHPLVLACRLNPGTVRRLRRVARRGGLGPGELVLTGGVAEPTLQQLYAQAVAFVFPSLEEGLGMPPLEAMGAGCPTLMARGSSLSELADDESAFFDGSDVASMAEAMTRVLSDEGVREQLRRTAAASSQRFTWQRCARLAWQALEALPSPPLSPSRPLVPPVRAGDSAAVAGLATRPGPVLLDAPPQPGPPGVLGLPLALRAALAPATALVAGDAERASAAVRAGLLDQPVLTDHSALSRVARRDFHAEYADGLATLVLEAGAAAQLPSAVMRSPRWTLERPRPVWLLLTKDEPAPLVQDLCDQHGLDLVVARPSGAHLGTSVDVVLVCAADVPGLLPALSRVRVKGARVVVLRRDEDEAAAPAWCTEVALTGPVTDPQAWRPLLSRWAGAWGRTTGWPWEGEGAGE